MKATNLIQTIALIGLMSSATAFAGKQDLKIFKTLASVGVQYEQEMSKTYLAVTDIECQTTLQDDRNPECHMTDTAGGNGAGSTLELTGRKARRMINLLAKLNAPSDAGMGHAWISAKGIVCFQAAEGVADGNAAERTTCDITLEQPEQN
jgi:hypothetical protein